MNFISSLCCFCCKSRPITNKVVGESTTTHSVPPEHRPELDPAETANISPVIQRPSPSNNPSMETQTSTVIIFDDSTTTTQFSPSLLQQIESTSRRCKHCRNLQEVTAYTKEIRENVIFVVTNEQKMKDILSVYADLPQMKAVYVLDRNADPVSNAKVTYFSDLTTLMHQIDSDMQPSDRGLLTYNFFDRNERTMCDLNEEAASFVWSQMLVDVLKKFPVDSHAIDDMITLCQKEYHDNPSELTKIEGFRMNYNRANAINWYTTDCFLYRLLNKALRTADIDALYIFRVFIVDLCSQLMQQRRLHPFPTSIITVYRGQVMFESELKKMIKNIGHLISVNAFFSASLDEGIAEVFSGIELTAEQKVSVVFQIEVDTRLQRTNFAHIDHLSIMNAEKEVLFSLFTVFKVINVVEECDKHRWRVYLQVTDEGREVLDEYMHLSVLEDAESPKQEIVFGRLIMQMGQYKKAIKYFQSLASRLEGDQPSIRAAIISNQSDCFYHMCKYKEAQECLENGLALLDQMNVSSTDILYLRCRFRLGNLLVFTNQLPPARIIYEDTLCKQRKMLPPDHVHIGDTLKAIGNWYGNETGYHKSLEYRRAALDIYEKSLPENHPKRIGAIISLAGTYEALGQFDKALDYLRRALQIQERYLPEDHPSRAKTLRSTGINEQALGHWDQAFDHYCQAYSIWMLQFPEGHVFTAYCLNLIGSIYRIRKQFDQALECQLNALVMRTSLFPPNTPQPHSSLGLTYLDIGDAEKAVETLKLACHYWQDKSTDSSNMYLNSIESYLGTAYSHNGQLTEALELFKRILTSQRHTHPDGNPDIGFTLHHMASNFVRMNLYTDAMQCYQESVDMLLKFFNDDHYEIVMIREKMGTLSNIIKKLQPDENLGESL